MYIGHARLCVCLYVCCCIPTLLHGPGCHLGEWYRVPSSCARCAWGRPRGTLFSPLCIHFIIFCSFLHFTFSFSHLLFLFSSFVHPFPFYENTVVSLHFHSRANEPRFSLLFILCYLYCLVKAKFHYAILLANQLAQASRSATSWRASCRPGFRRV